MEAISAMDRMTGTTQTHDATNIQIVPARPPSIKMKEDDLLISLALAFPNHRSGPRKPYVRIEIQVHITVEVRPSTDTGWKFLCYWHKFPIHFPRRISWCSYAQLLCSTQTVHISFILICAAFDGGDAILVGG